jgi:hypothetical protein
MSHRPIRQKLVDLQRKCRVRSKTGRNPKRSLRWNPKRSFRRSLKRHSAPTVERPRPCGRCSCRRRCSTVLVLGELMWVNNREESQNTNGFRAGSPNVQRCLTSCWRMRPPGRPVNPELSSARLALCEETPAYGLAWAWRCRSTLWGLLDGLGPVPQPARLPVVRRTMPEQCVTVTRGVP